MTAQRLERADEAEEVNISFLLFQVQAARRAKGRFTDPKSGQFPRMQPRVGSFANIAPADEPVFY